MSLGHSALGESPIGTGAGASAPIFALASVDISATLPVAAAQTLAHGFALDGVATIPVTGSMGLEHAAIAADITLSASVPVQAASDVVHGVSVAAVATVAVQALQAVAHGIAVDGIAAIALSAAADITVLRYEVRGEVREGGVLVNRRIRAYLRSTGALVGEADTVAGKFSIHTGFTLAEHYVTPIDLSEFAADWLPPTANRIVPVLAHDLT